MADQTGSCMCGAVRFSATDVPDTYGVCHCEMCRRWAGSAYVNVEVQSDKITWTGEENIRTFQSSTWAERGWCGKCGASLFWRRTNGIVEFASTDIPLGLFDEPNHFTLSREIFIDHKPHGFALVNEGQKKLTRAECIARFAPQVSELGEP